jgi:hypothetical protein
MPASTMNSKLVLPCKECRQPVNDSESNGYRLIEGVLYGWCNECFGKRRNRGGRFQSSIVSAPSSSSVSAAEPEPVPVGATDRR